MKPTPETNKGAGRTTLPPPRTGVSALAWVAAFVWSCLNLIAATELAVGKGATLPETLGTVAVTLNTDAAVVALQMEIAFDSAVLMASPALLKDLAATHQIVSSQPESGVQRIVVYSLRNTPLPSGAVILLRFTPRAGLVEGATINIEPRVAIISSPAGERVTPVQLTAGTLSISKSSGVKPAKFDSITAGASGTVDLQLTGGPAQRHEIQASVDLREWKVLDTYTIPAGGVLKINDPAGPQFRSRFYRAVSR